MIVAQHLQRKRCGRYQQHHERITLINLIMLATLYGIIIIITQPVELTVEGRFTALNFNFF